MENEGIYSKGYVKISCFHDLNYFIIINVIIDYQYGLLLVVLFFLQSLDA